MGGAVDLFSIVPVKRSHSVCAQGGINAAKNLKGEGDSTWQHFDDTIYGGDFLANQPPVKAMCEAAPGIIDLLDRMGVPFNRTPEGSARFPALRRDVTTALPSPALPRANNFFMRSTNRYGATSPKAKSKNTRPGNFSPRSSTASGVCRGICAMDLRTMEVRTFPADAVIIATGGVGAIFGKSTNSVGRTGSAQSALNQQGCYYANGEFIQVHPTSGPGCASPASRPGPRGRSPSCPPA